MAGQTISADEFKKRYGTQPNGFPTQEPPQIQRSFIERVGRVADSIFGGGKVGEALGGAYARYIDPQGRRLAQMDPEFAQQGFGGFGGTGVTGKEIAGSALKGAVSVGAAALPGAGSLVGKIAQGATLGYASDIAGNLENNQAKFTPGLGTAVGVALPVAAKALGALTRRTLGATTGTGNQVIKRAIENPNEVNEAIRQYARDDASKMGLVERAKAVVQDFLLKRSDDYNSGLDEVSKKMFITKKGQLYIKRVITPEDVKKGMAASKAVGTESFIQANLSTKGIKDTLTKTLRDFGAKGSKGVFEYKEVALPKASTRQLNELTSRIYEWEDLTPTGLNKLRQIVDSYHTGGKNLPLDKIIGNLRTNLSKYVEKQVPLIGTINQTYSKQTSQAANLVKELGLSANAKPSTQLNSIMRLFKKDPQVIKNLTEIMGEQEANKLLNDISGAILSEALPQGLSGMIKEGGLTLGGLFGIMTGAVSIPTVLGSAASTSPRLVGEATTLTGKAIKKGVGTGIRRATTIGASRSSQ